jgi:2-polyprenyl-3-methyl-5-hydroxy-6-metoxy-1,4-benzoquinol methylase
LQEKSEGQQFDIGLEEIIPEYYSKNPFVRWLFNRRLYCALEQLKSVNPHRVVDLGCGDGSFLKLMTRRGGINVTEMWGVDTNPAILEFKDKISNCSFKVHDIQKTNFPDGTFDVVVCLDVQESRKVYMQLELSNSAFPN